MIHLDATAILFDMDGTLIDSSEASEITWQRWSAAHGVPIEHIRRVHHGCLPAETVSIVAPHLDAAAEGRGIYDSQEQMTGGIRSIAGANAFFDPVPVDHAAIVTAATTRILQLRLGLVGIAPPAVCITARPLGDSASSPRTASSSRTRRQDCSLRPVQGCVPSRSCRTTRSSSCARNFRATPYRSRSARTSAALPSTAGGSPHRDLTPQDCRGSSPRRSDPVQSARRESTAIASVTSQGKVEPMSIRVTCAAPMLAPPPLSPGPLGQPPKVVADSLEIWPLGQRASPVARSTPG
jgi:hypothetical protein